MYNVWRKKLSYVGKRLKRERLKRVSLHNIFHIKKKNCIETRVIHTLYCSYSAAQNVRPLRTRQLQLQMKYEKREIQDLC